VQSVFVFVQVLNEADDAADVVILPDFRRIDALIAQLDLQALVEKRELAHTALQDINRELGRLEDLRIREEPLNRSGALGRTDLLELACDVTTLETDLVQYAVALDLRDHFFG